MKIKISRILKNLPLGKKMILTMIGLFLTLTVFLSVYLYQDGTQALKNQAHLILTNTAEKNQRNFDYSIKEAENLGFEVVNSEVMVNFMQRYATNQSVNDNVSFDFQTTVMKKIRQLMSDARVIENVTVYLDDYQFIVGNNNFVSEEGFGDVSKIPDYQWQTSPKETRLLLPYNIFEVNAKKRGYLSIQINPERFFQSISENNQLQNGFLVLADNQVIYDPAGGKKIQDTLQAADPSGSSILKDNFLFNRLPLVNGWQVITYYSMNSFDLDVSGFFQRVLLASAVVLVAAIVFGHFFSRWLVRPIQRLNRQIQRRDEKQLPMTVQVVSNDEVGQLSISYNQMVADLDHLLRQVKQEEQARHDAQLSAYQAQIQPHFLYNTLAIISWSAKKGDKKQVEEITKNLAKYYRLVLAKGKRIASLQDELDLVHYYLEIQKIRFSDQLSAEIEVDPAIDTKKYYIMHRILQPLVENALEHGVFPQGVGKIKVTVCEDSSRIYLYVADNGVGATEEVVNKINNMEGFGNEKRGFSLASIVQALKSYYRSALYFSFDSIEGEGTMVTIVVDKLALVKEGLSAD